MEAQLYSVFNINVIYYQSFRRSEGASQSPDCTMGQKLYLCEKYET